MKWKEIIADYFSFSRRDRIAIITLFILIALVFFLPNIVSNTRYPKSSKTDTAWIAAMQRMEKKENKNERPAGNREDDNNRTYFFDRPETSYDYNVKGELFYFDPNTLTVEGWQRLGLREKTIHTIQHYIAKGGRFKKPADLQKIYGLFPNEYARIAPFIKIEISDDPVPGKNSTFSPVTGRSPVKNDAPRYQVIDINTADTSAFISLPGIGSKLAARIINFREKLGGFYSVNQVGETFGLPDSTYRKIKPYLEPGNVSVRKININAATLDELKAHPYIRWNLANPIIAYRNEHGPFTHLEELKKVMAVTEEIFLKISPYLKTE